METRWSSRAIININIAAVNIVVKKLSEVVTALEQLMKKGEIAITRSDASLILDSIVSFSFLSLWKSVLPDVNDAQKNLQAKGLDLQQSSVKLTALRDCFLWNREKMVDSA